jgi:hypothetical protein
MSHLICLSTDEVEVRLRALGLDVKFTPEEKVAYQTTPVVISDFRVFGFPLPALRDPVTLLKLHQICGVDPSKQPAFFDHPWYYDEAFMRTGCHAGWHFIAMDVLPDSIDQPRNYIDSHFALELPSAIEITLMLFLHFVGTGEQLLHKKHTWSSDEASLGRSVTVGAFGRNGVFISAHPPVFSSRGLGVCGKIRPRNVL